MVVIIVIVSIGYCENSIVKPGMSPWLLILLLLALFLS